MHRLSYRTFFAGDAGVHLEKCRGGGGATYMYDY